MILVIVVVLVVVLACGGWALARVADLADTEESRLLGEEPARWDDPNWEWPAGSREARVDEAIREMERTL